MSDRDGDDDIDDASLRSMRAVWLSMRDEEPPAAGMSALLAAARDQAEQLRAPSMWQRMLAQLRRPPALAFATVMLLIGGAVLVTRNVEQQVPSMKADTPAPELPKHDLDRQLPATVPVEEAAPEPVESEKADAPARPVVKDVATKPKPQKPKARASAQDVGKNEPDRHQRFEDDEPKAGFAQGRGADKPTVLESPGGGVPPAPPPSPPKKSEPAKEPAGEAVILSDGKVSTPPNEQLARQAESAASRGDCPAVRVIVAKMKQQDESFYKARLGKNAAVTKCL